MTEIRCINRSGNIVLKEKNQGPINADSVWKKMYWPQGWEISYHRHSLITWKTLLERLRQKYPEDFIEMEQIQGSQKYLELDVKPVSIDFDEH